MSDKVIEHDEQFDDEALDDEDRTLATTEDDEDVQDVVPVGERGIAGTPTVTGAPHRSPVEYVPSWLPG